MPDIKTIADKADVIINGYAFTCEDGRIRVLNLNSPDKAVVFSVDGEVLETTMDDIELSIASRYLKQNLKYLSHLSALWSACTFTPATASLPKADRQSFLSRAMAMLSFKTAESSMTGKSLRFPSSSRIIIRKCISAGRSTAKRVTITDSR